MAKVAAGTSKVDLIDKKLIETLQKDGKQSSEVLAKQLKVSSATVKRRLKRLIDDEILRIVAVVNPAKMGINLTAVLALDASQDKIDAIMQSLNSHPEVRWVSTTTGRFDIIALTHFSNADDLSEFLESVVAKIDGVKDTETFICLRRQKVLYSPGKSL